MRFDFTPSSFSQGGDNFGWVGISSNSNEGRGTQDFHGMMFRGDGSNARYCANEGSSATLETNWCAGSDVDIGSQWSTSTTYYFEILKVGNTIEVKRYTDDTYGTVADTTGQQTGTTSTGLQYFKVTNWNSGSGSGQTEGKIDNILIQQVFSDTTGTMFSFENTSGENILYEIESDKLRVAKEALGSTTVFSLDGTSTSGFTNSDGILSSSGGEFVITDSGTNHKAYTDFTETNGDFTLTYKVEFQSGGDGGGIGLHDGSDSSWSNWSGSYAHFMGVYFANGGWMYAGAHTGSGWNSPSNDLCSNSAYSSGSTQQLSSGDERWVTVDKTATQFVVKVYTDSARSNLVCTDTRAFTDGGTSMTGFDRLSFFTKWQSQSHDYRFDDILIAESTMIKTNIIEATGQTISTSTPSHIQFNRGTSNDWEIFLDGTSVATNTDSTSLGTVSSDTYFIGGQGSVSTGSEGNDDVNDVAHFEGTVGAGFAIGEQIQAGNSLIGKTITGLSFDLYKLSTGASNCDTETFTFGIFDTSGNLEHSFGNLVCSDITNTGSAHTDAVTYTKSDGSHVLVENEVVAIRTNDNPNSQWTVEVTQRDSDVYSNGTTSNTKLAIHIMDNIG